MIKQFVDNDMMEQLFQNTRERRSRVSEGPGTGMGSSLSASSAYTPTGHPPQDIKLEGEEYYKLKLADVGNPTRRAVFLKGQTRSFKSDTVRIGRFDSNQPEIAQEVAHSALTSTSQSEAGDDILESARMPYELEKMVRSSEYYPARRVESPDPGSSSTSTTVVRTRKAYTMKDLPMKTEHLCMMSGPVDSDDVLEDWDIAEPEPKHFDIQSLLSQWTTLSAKEIARGNDPSR